MTTENYSGPERRASQLKLDEALAEVQRLNQAATTLAEAVAKTAHRSELITLQQKVEKNFWIMTIVNAGLTAFIILMLIFFFNSKINNLGDKIKDGQAVIACLEGKTEIQKTGDFAATALVTCEQSVRR